MTKEELKELKYFVQSSNHAAPIFEGIEKIAKMLQTDDKFKTFAQNQAKDGFLSPLDILIVASDYINQEGKYKKYLENNKTKAASVKEQVKEKIDIFSLNL